MAWSLRWLLSWGVNQFAEERRFLPPMEDPNDVSQINRDRRSKLAGPALERAEATARHLQAQRYRFNEDLIKRDGNGNIIGTTLEIEDMTSKKLDNLSEKDRKRAITTAQSKLDRLNKMWRAMGTTPSASVIT